MTYEEKIEYYINRGKVVHEDYSLMLGHKADAVVFDEYNRPISVCLKDNGDFVRQTVAGDWARKNGAKLELFGYNIEPEVQDFDEEQFNEEYEAEFGFDFDNLDE